MELIIGRGLMPFLRGVAVFLAIRYLTGSSISGLAVGLIPFLLGVLGVGGRISAAVTALSIVAALCWLATPESTRTVLRSFASATFDDHLPAAGTETAGIPTQTPTGSMPQATPQASPGAVPPAIPPSPSQASKPH
ncbi:MAG TPA: hypothetical protein VHE37_02570 [Nevskiaceae bacterium]|nr:hypothetical protein [Nevskiaceae bacterium]